MRTSDPYGAHRFRVTCDALPRVGFTAVRGLSVTVTVDGDDTATGPPATRGRRRRGRRPKAGPPAERGTRSPTLELRRGLSEERALWTWLREWVDGTVDPQDVRVCVLDGRGRPVRGWVCRAATPVRWTGPDLVADRGTVATETLELAHEGIDAVTDLDECSPGGP